MVIDCVKCEVRKFKSKIYNVTTHSLMKNATGPLLFHWTVTTKQFSYLLYYAVEMNFSFVFHFNKIFSLSILVIPVIF